MMDEKQGLMAKMARIMGSIDRLPQSGYNNHFKYSYATAEDVSDVIRAALARENIAFFAAMTNLQQEGKHTVVTFEYTFVCADTGQTHKSTWFGEADDNQDKGISKAATLAEKSFFLKMFVLSSGDPADDPDSQAPVSDKDDVRLHQTAQKPPQRAASTARSSGTPAPANGAQNGKADAIETVDDIVLVEGATWPKIMHRLIEAELAQNSYEAFGRLKKIAADLPGYDDNNLFPAIQAAKWTEHDVKTKFKERIAQ